MILTFEVTGNEMEVHFDSEGRDQLISLLSSCKGPGDHAHMFKMSGVVNPRPGNLITQEQFDTGSTLMESVTLYLMDGQPGPPDDAVD